MCFAIAVLYLSLCRNATASASFALFIYSQPIVSIRASYICQLLH